MKRCSEITANHLGETCKCNCSQHITQDDGPDVTGMRTGVTGSQHADNDAEGNTVHGCANEVIIGQNEQAKHTDVHQENMLAVVGREVPDGLVIGQQTPVCLHGTTHEPGHHDTTAKQDNTEHITDDRCCHRQGFCQCRQFNAAGLEQRCVQEESSHTHRQRCGIQGETLMDLGRIGQAARQEKADKAANNQRQNHTEEAEANGTGIRITKHQFRDQGRKTRGEQHGMDQTAELFLVHQAVQNNAQHAEPHIQDIDTPGTETGS